jgi:MoxR-like ATPase
VGIGEAALQACQALREWLAAQGVMPCPTAAGASASALMRTVAATEGRDRLDALDLWLAPYVASPTPDWVPRIAAWFEADLLQAVPQQAPWLTRAVEAFEKQLQIEETAEPTKAMAACRQAGPGAHAGGPRRNRRWPPAPDVCIAGSQPAPPLQPGARGGHG